jgi:hypothetical protein
MRTIIFQSYRRANIPWWISRCLASAEAWARASGFEYSFHGDEVFDLCGRNYLDSVKGNVRSITNLARLELVRDALRRDYDRAVWLDADVFVFDQENFQISVTQRYAFARETWVERRDTGFFILHGVNNCAFAFMRGEPDLDLLINITRHVALHRKITSNYQVGGDILKGLRSSLAFTTLENVGMFSPSVIAGIAQNDRELLARQALEFGSAVFAANLAAAAEYHEPVVDDDLRRAMDSLESSRGDIINQYLSTSQEASAANARQFAKDRPPVDSKFSIISRILGRRRKPSRR